MWYGLELSFYFAFKYFCIPSHSLMIASFSCYPDDSSFVLFLSSIALLHNYCLHHKLPLTTVPLLQLLFILWDLALLSFHQFQLEILEKYLHKFKRYSTSTPHDLSSCFAYSSRYEETLRSTRLPEFCIQYVSSSGNVQARLQYFLGQVTSLASGGLFSILICVTIPTIQWNQNP